MRPPSRSSSKKSRGLTPDLGKDGQDDTASTTGSSISPWATGTLTSSRRAEEIDDLLQVKHQASNSRGDKFSLVSERLKAIDAELEPEAEAEALRFLELPVEKAGGRRRRLLAQLGENTKQMDVWLRRLENREAPRPRMESPQPSECYEPRVGRPRRPFRRGFVVHGPVRKGFGLRRPPRTWVESQSVSNQADSSIEKPFEELLEEARFQDEEELRYLPAEEREIESRLAERDDEELLLADWKRRWYEQELEERRQSSGELQLPRGEKSCHTPSFGEAAASVSSPQAIGTSDVSSDEAEEFEAEVRMIAAGCGFVQDGSQELCRPVEDGRVTPAKHRVTLEEPRGGSPVRRQLGALSESGDEGEEQKAQAEREERIMRFCPEVMDAALSADSRQAQAQSMARGASKVLAEHRGHQKNLERMKMSAEEHEQDPQEALGRRRSADESALQRAVSLHRRGQCRSAGRPWRRRGTPAPPLRSAPPRPERASPDFRKMRQDLPRKERIIAARRSKKKQEALRQCHQRVSDLSFGVTEALGRTPSPRPCLLENRPVICSPEVAAWRSPTPLEQRLQEEPNVVAGSQWREFLEGIRFGRMGAQSAKRREPKPTSRDTTKEPSLERLADLEKTRNLIDTGKVADCPDAHAAHLLRQGNVQALERWGGLRFARAHVLSQGLFRAARTGQLELLSWLLEEIGGIYLSNEAVHWREKGGARPSLLHVAAEADLVAACAILEERGADLEALDDRGRQPCQVAGPCVREVWEEYGSFLRYFETCPQSGTIRIQTSPAMSLSQALTDTTSSRRMFTTPTLLLSPAKRS